MVGKDVKQCLCAEKINFLCTYIVKTKIVCVGFYESHTLLALLERANKQCQEYEYTAESESVSRLPQTSEYYIPPPLL